MPGSSDIPTDGNQPLSSQQSPQQPSDPIGSEKNPLFFVPVLSNPLCIKQVDDNQVNNSPQVSKKKSLYIVGVLVALILLTIGIFALWIHQQYILAIALVVLTFGGLIYAGYMYPHFTWTGFGRYTGPEDRDHQPRTFWDWLALLIIPVVLSAGAIGFSIQQANDNTTLTSHQYTNDTNIAATRYANDLNIAATQYANAQQLALESTFQTYLDHMSDLLTNQHVHDNTQQGADIRSLATARTLTILPDLSLSRRATVLKFLHDAGLIGRQIQGSNIIDPIVNLSGADFSRVDLSNFALSGADLAVANFSGAILNGADLRSAYLSNTNLSDAKLKGANICTAQVTEHANLSGADLSNADLGGADLISADLSGASLSGANLGNNDKVCPGIAADLSNTNMNGAHLNDADLTAVKLNNADLTNATLNNAKLIGTQLKNAQLNGASLTNADLTNANLTGAIEDNNTDFTNVIWKNTTCADTTNSDSNTPNSCDAH